MLEIEGDIWSYAGNAVIAITTNGSISKRGKALLGRGVARQAGEKFPTLAENMGKLLMASGNRVHILGNGLVSFPVEETAWSLPDLKIITRSAIELSTLADEYGWQQIIVPKPGCGGGGLAWRDVRPRLLPWFDDRFTVISLEEIPPY